MPPEMFLLLMIVMPIILMLIRDDVLIRDDNSNAVMIPPKEGKKVKQLPTDAEIRETNLKLAAADMRTWEQHFIGNYGYMEGFDTEFYPQDATDKFFKDLFDSHLEKAIPSGPSNRIVRR